MRAFSFIICAFCLLSSGIAQNKTSVDQLVSEKTYEIRSNWASPLAGTTIANMGLLPTGSDANNISLIGNENYLIKKGDEIDVFLPYYGELRVAGRNLTNNTIKFKATVEKYKAKYNKSKKRHIISFKARHEQELYNFTITLYSNHRSSVSISSSKRSPITYRGTVKEITSIE